MKTIALLDQMSTMQGTDTSPNRQFILSCKARLFEIMRKPPCEILDITKEGIAITYPEFDPNNFNGEALLFHEPQLIHMHAVAHGHSGETGKAINLLQ